jgi:CubicO group peptidase (beta-lactamase class C family)
MHEEWPVLMKAQWRGDPELVQAVEGVLQPSGAAAVAVITSQRELVATAGADGNSTFEIGSISKTLTGMLYRDAVERGLVNETAVLKELLPLDRHGAIGSVTLSSLATHRSGLPGLPPGMHPLRRSLDLWLRGENPYGDSLADLLEQTRTVRIGAHRPKYSNLGFQLLGHAVAGAVGTSYEPLVHEVLGRGFSAPSHMEDLGPSDLPGFSRLGRPTQAWVGEALAPAGGVRASITTMSELLRSLLDGTARGISALDPVADFTSRSKIGAGWMTLEVRGHTITWHNGSTGGFSSCIGLNREAGVGVVVLSATHKAVDGSGVRLLMDFTKQP